jgi:soluble lytic murein transglycosylase-like protein
MPRAPLFLLALVVLPVSLPSAALFPGTAQAQIQRSVDSSGVISISGGRSKTSKSSSAPSDGPATHMPSDTSQGRLSRYDEHIREAATLYRLPAAYIRAILQTESNYDPRAVSPAGAIGLMQLMPFTAERMLVQDIYDPRQNILGGARYLRILANQFNGDIHLTTAAYNAGEHAVIRYGGIPPYEETQGYVVKVLENYERYRAAEAE